MKITMPNNNHMKNPPLNLVLLGESGSGKSMSGNTILGKNAFISQASSTPITTECQFEEKHICGKDVKVTDTPDFFDDDLQQLETHIMKCRQLCVGHLCVYLVVIQIGRFTIEERDTLERLEDALRTNIRDRAIILFTHGDDLGSPKIKSIEDYVSTTNTHLQTLIRDCGNRYQVFNNKDKTAAKQQVKELMKKIAELVQETDGAEVFVDLTGNESLKYWIGAAILIGVGLVVLVLITKGLLV